MDKQLAWMSWVAVVVVAAAAAASDVAADGSAESLF